MDSISINTGKYALECAAEKYTKQIVLSKDYKIFLSKKPNKLSHMFKLSIDMSGK